MPLITKDRVVKVRYEVYKRLLELQSRLQINTGRRVSFNEVIEKLLALYEERGKLPNLLANSDLT